MQSQNMRKKITKVKNGKIDPTTHKTSKKGKQILVNGLLIILMRFTF